MKICILTQPLHGNYGGVLQAYALQLTLKRMGHEVWTEDRKPNKSSFIYKLKRINFLRSLVGKKKLVLLAENEEYLLLQHIAKFINENIRLTTPINSTSKSKLKKYGFDAYVVGSDQVWRPCYSFGIYNYYLDFTYGQHVKRIAYAASFGVDNWEYTKKQTQKCSFLAKQFDAISVREDSAISLCYNNLGVNAIHVLDPTMLLDSKDYVNLVLEDKVSLGKKHLMIYILDRSEEKQNIIQIISDQLSLELFEMMPLFLLPEVGAEKLESCIFPPVTKWIQGFMHAGFVITDSFHGCVFSIIFEKPFIAIVNNERGASRFRSLLTMFGLMDRMVNSLSEVTDEILKAPIDWNVIRRIKEQKIDEAKNFLKNNLNSND